MDGRVYEAEHRADERALVFEAQALAYKIASLKMMELRKRAQSTLGDRFDIRELHEWILGQGSMPLGALEASVDQKIAASRR